jgi:NhaP-type Na+/H+ or K+/H+ antiporter
VLLTVAIGAFLLAERVQTDAGFLAVIVLAVALPNQGIVRPIRIRGLPEEARSCLEAVLLVWVAARLRVTDVALVGAGGFACVGFLVLIARPAALLLATAGSEAARGERLTLLWQAPRALIPAAAAAFFGVRLVDGGHNGAEHLVPLVLLAVSTAAVCELLAPVVAPLVPERRRQPETAVTSTARPAS